MEIPPGGPWEPLVPLEAPRGSLGGLKEPLGPLGPQVLGERWGCMEKPWPEIAPGAQVLGNLWVYTEKPWPEMAPGAPSPRRPLGLHGKKQRARNGPKSSATLGFAWTQLEKTVKGLVEFVFLFVFCA